jgi:TonB family protein
MAAMNVFRARASITKRAILLRSLSIRGARMRLKTSLSLLCVAVFLLGTTLTDAARKHPRRTAHHAAVAQPYGAGLDDAQSRRALESEISRKLGSAMQAGDYPEEARREGWSGTTWVDVLVGSNGKIKEVGVQRSSGFAVLDEQAVRMVDRINIWWIPQRLRHREVRVAVPVGFIIRDDPGPRWISAAAANAILERMVSLPERLCRNLVEDDADDEGSSINKLAPLLPAMQDSVLAGWSALHTSGE